jgi:hypothetical protein
MSERMSEAMSERMSEAMAEMADRWWNEHSEELSYTAHTVPPRTHIISHFRKMAEL